MPRKVIAIIIGFLAIIAVEKILVVGPPRIITLFISNFAGGFFAVLIAKQHGLIYGTIVSIGALLLLITSLMFISYRASGGMIFYPEIDTLYPNLFSVILGPIGGYVGEKMSKRYAKKVLGSVQSTDTDY